MKNILKCNGKHVTVSGHNLHLYIQGRQDAPAIVFMAGHCTVAPVYDFKVLYEKLLPDFKVIVIEKYGYGYSDIWESSCDIDSLVSIQRQALALAQETGPYVFAPHSMSGLEAIRWKQLFPQEVAGSIGMDMATPLSFSVWSEEDIKKNSTPHARFEGFRLDSVLTSLNNRALTDDEKTQHQLLKKRNAFNICCINEAKEVLKNARIIDAAGSISCPTLMFSSNGEDQERDWVANQQRFAAAMGAKLIQYDCGHYIHHFKSDEMRKEITEFIHSLAK